MRETAKGYISNDGNEFNNYLECQVYEEYVERGLVERKQNRKQNNNRYYSDNDGYSRCFFTDIYDPTALWYR